MGVPYSYFEATLPEMNVGEELKTWAQLAMPWGNEDAHTILRFLGESPSPKFEHYLINHQVDFKINATWRGETIKRLIRNEEFDAFFNRSEGYILMKANKKLARNAVERLQEAALDLKLKIERPSDINLHVMERLGRTTGGYFGSLNIRNVKSAALFGEDVDSSEEWDHYAEAGEVSALLLEVVANDDIRSLVLTRERVILLHTRTMDHEDLDFVAAVHQQVTEEIAGNPGNPAAPI